MHKTDLMALLRVNAENNHCRMHGSPCQVRSALISFRQLDTPVIIMIHGYSYEPDNPVHCPHRLVLRLPNSEIAHAAPSWPQGLGFGKLDPAEGLGIAFGWTARGSIWAARRRALSAGRALAKLVTALRQRAPHRKVHFVAHSLGIEVAAEAMQHLPAGAVGRIVSITGAAYGSRVLSALQSPAGQSAEFINVISRANAPFDRLYETLVAPPQNRDRALGHGLKAPNLLNLQLDCPDTLRRLNQMGTPIGTPVRRICHWSGYTRAGALACYNRWLRDTKNYSFLRLVAALPDPTRAPVPRQAHGATLLLKRRGWSHSSSHLKGLSPDALR